MKQPAILYQVRVDDADKRRLHPVMQNWLRAHAYTTKLPRNWKGYEELRRMLWFELNNAKRMDVALRIFRRMMQLMKELHERDILEMFP